VRARAALEQPLASAHAVPAADCRRWHTVGGERVLSSILVVEPGRGGLEWRASVTVWGLADEQREALAWVLAHQLLTGLGVGPTTVETSGPTTFVWRAISAEERAVLRSASGGER